MKRMSKKSLAAGLIWAVVAVAAFGRIPEPDTIVVGSVANSPAGCVLEVRAVVDGTTLASSEVTGYPGAFVLRIPMDDGAAPRLAGTAKANDRVRLVLVDTMTGAETETLETADGGLEIPSGRGQVLWGTFRVAEGVLSGGDADGDGMPDAWETSYATGKNGHAGLNAKGDDASADNDGDGRTNWQEYVAGTDPLDENSVFGVVSIAVDGSEVTVKAGPGATGRKYSLMWTDSLGNGTEWRMVATAEGSVDGEEVALPWTEALGGGYFRVDVEVAK